MLAVADLQQSCRVPPRLFQALLDSSQTSAEPATTCRHTSLLKSPEIKRHATPHRSNAVGICILVAYLLICTLFTTTQGVYLRLKRESISHSMHIRPPTSHKTLVSHTLNCGSGSAEVQAKTDSDCGWGDRSGKQEGLRIKRVVSFSFGF